MYVCVLVAQLCLILCNPCPWDSPGKKLEWVAISFSKWCIWQKQNFKNTTAES